MEMVGGFTFLPLEITKDGRVHDSAQVEAVMAAVRGQQGSAAPSDLLVICHGWNNDMDEARSLYATLLGNVNAVLRRGGAQPQLAVVGVFWPSKRFADEDLIPAGGSGGTAAVGGGGMPGERLKEELERLKGTFDRPDTEALERAKALVDELEDSMTAGREFADILRSLLPPPTDGLEDNSGGFFAQPGDELLERLRAPIRLRASGQGGVARMDDGDDRGDGVGGAASFGDLFSGLRAAAWKLLNYTTYYQMKERAGVVGGGLNRVLADVRAARRDDLRIHLVGHSFGARVVTAATDGQAALAPANLVLLQGAFSHNGFARDFDEDHHDGFFRKVIDGRKVAGPIVATHTANDRAVGLAYAIASRISGDNRAAFGDADDMFGGIGRNGAVRMGPGETVSLVLLDASGSYTLSRGVIHNMLADDHISSHSAVSNAAVANLIVAALRA
jgi:hypothetical protein